ncbi:ThuA domain-containing protein [Novosphingobium bradum]|uniref:ThuA domain-containing protein n=1 Tax=Novosphingobium bradum TaxID=1737444 RepID=A0ABV7IR60_9SPHN
MVRKILKIAGIVLLGLVAIIAVIAASQWEFIQRMLLGGLKVYETEPPAMPAEIKHPALLVFSKTNAFRHEEAIPAANALFDDLARQRGWTVFKTENGATFSPAILARFDAVVFSNVSGDVLTLPQRQAFQNFVQNGGGFVGIHAAGDNSHTAWPWYVQNIIGAKWIGHPMDPQFQKATVRVENHEHPASATLPAAWQRVDEWYSYEKSPRGVPGLTVLATLDERTYKPGSLWGTKLAMGADHPIAWWRCTGKGRVFYSALGHTAASYTEPENRALLAGALAWSMRLEGEACGTKPLVTTKSEAPAGETAK